MNKTFVTILLVAVANTICSSDRHSLADEPNTIAIAPCDQVWLVSAREYDEFACPSTERLNCQRFFGDQCQWIHSNCEEMARSSFSDDVQTVVFVHGYQTDLQNAQQRGLQVYQNLFGCDRCSGPIRFVIWAWRSEKECRRPVVDFAVKAKRAAALGDVFAMTLNELGPRAPVVIGYSLGAQVAVSGLAMSSLYSGQPIRLAVIAAANDCGFASGCQQMHVCGNIDQSLIFLNESDRAIRAAHLICKMKHGKLFRPFDELAVQNKHHLGQINIIDVTDVASAKHSIVRYTSLPVIKSCIDQLVVENSTWDASQAILSNVNSETFGKESETILPAVSNSEGSNTHYVRDALTNAKLRH